MKVPSCSTILGADDSHFPFLPRRNMQKRDVYGVYPKLLLTFCLQSFSAHILVIFIQHLVPSKNWFWITWSKHLVFGRSWQECFLISSWHPLSSCLSAFAELYENLLKKAKSAQISIGLIRKKEVLIESIVGQSNIHLKSGQFICFFFPLRFPKCLHIHSFIKSPWWP